MYEKEFDSDKNNSKDIQCNSNKFSGNASFS